MIKILYTFLSIIFLPFLIEGTITRGVTKRDLNRWNTEIQSIKTDVQAVQTQAETISTDLVSYQDNLKRINQQLQTIISTLILSLQNGRNPLLEEETQSLVVSLHKKIEKLFPTTRTGGVTITTLLSELVIVKDALTIILQDLETVASEIQEAAK